MDKVIYYARKVILLIAAIVCVFLTYENTILPTPEHSNEIRLFDYYVDTYYDRVSDNSGITSINGVSNVYVNMLDCSYIEHYIDIQSNYIDMSFIGTGGDAYRFYYDMKTNLLTFFYSDYERSNTGESYIIERKGEN